jgi:transposase
MALMTVNDHNERGEDYRSQPRWSAGKKTEVVLRLLRGESLEELSRELQVEAYRLAAWRDDVLAAGSQGGKGKRSDRSPDDRALKQAERKIGQLTLENEVLRAAAETRGLQIHRRSDPDRHGPRLPRVLPGSCSMRRAVRSRTADHQHRPRPAPMVARARR